MRFYF